MNKLSEIPIRIINDERLRGARLLVGFRWVFVALLLVLLSVQYFSGYRTETSHALVLIAVYSLVNVLITIALKQNYDPTWLRFTLATIDISIIAFHLYYISGTFDPVAASAAATTFLFPVMILLYTFRLERKLLIFTTLFAIFCFNLVYFLNYFSDPAVFKTSLSLSPTSQIFKSSYLLFIGFLCVHMQHSLKRLIIKQMNESRRNLDAEIELSLEQQKNAHAEELIRQERKLNQQLAQEIHEREEAEKAFHESQIRFRELTDFLPQTVYELDPEGNVVFTNRAGIELFGEKAKAGSEKMSAIQFFIPEDRERMVRNMKEKLEGRGKIFNEYTAICADGRHCPVIIYSSPIIREGVAVGSRGIIVEISELKRVEADLRKAKQELEELNERLEMTIQERTAQLTEANTQLLRLQKENLQSQFDVLKQQVNPHFLFNSLNVLISLIKLEPNLAETFTERLAKVYRYVLENRDENLVTVRTELDFLKAYVFLIDTRFQGKVLITFDLDEEKENRLVLPLSLQLLIENAIKHNAFSTKSPLKIRLFIDEHEYLNVVNNLQARGQHIVSTGVGLSNISSRYSLICDKVPVFEQTENEFIAKIPLLER